MILLFTGNGKGKTTASLGQMVRVLGRGKTALMIQFIKGPWISGEDELAGKFQISSDKFQIRKMGLGFVGILGDRIPLEEHKKAARKALDGFIEEKNSGKWHLIILDEINVAVSLGLLRPAEVLEAVKDFPENRILILSGRGAPQEFIDAADLATEMREIKHPFQQGKKAKFTVEF
ncbi:MAG: cob(I)yrinic acid a,c-diamide adenosyltransferase [Patescibacteria group bacterium]|nr:cob(I)yrinic acid a,c-diamide adenosyltransferase [Patescibacteria group bacterium]